MTISSKLTCMNKKSIIFILINAFIKKVIEFSIIILIKYIDIIYSMIEYYYINLIMYPLCITVCIVAHFFLIIAQLG